jgi:tetratricopeptide (TPR) repeat protein
MPRRFSSLNMRCALMLVLVTAASPLTERAVGAAAPDVGRLLDAYAAGQFTAAMEPMARMSSNDAGEYRQQLTTEAGVKWIDRIPEARPRRALVAAAFALEAEAALAERGLWQAATGEKPCPGRCVIEWACTLLRLRGEPDEAERVWMLASIALAGGVRNWTFLLSPLTPPRARARVQGHVLHALERFPNEPRIHLARALAIASRHAVMTEMGMPRAGQRTLPVAGRMPNIIIIGPGAPPEPLEDLLRPNADYARRELSVLTGDPTIGAEARMRLAYVQFQARDYESAASEARAAADRASDPDVKYLSHYLGGQALQSIGDLPAAEAQYRSALEALPRAQSATLALAALVHARGDANTAYELAAASIGARPPAPDPWRHFMYGDFPRLPGLIAEMRKAITQ